MRPLMATHLELAAPAGDTKATYDVVRQVSVLPTGLPVATATSLETATRVAREEPDEDGPIGYETITKVASEDPDEPPAWIGEAGGVLADAVGL